MNGELSGPDAFSTLGYECFHALTISGLPLVNIGVPNVPPDSHSADVANKNRIRAGRSSHIRTDRIIE